MPTADGLSIILVFLPFISTSSATFGGAFNKSLNVLHNQMFETSSSAAASCKGLIPEKGVPRERLTLTD